MSGQKRRKKKQTKKEKRRAKQWYPSPDSRPVPFTHSLPTSHQVCLWYCYRNTKTERWRTNNVSTISRWPLMVCLFFFFMVYFRIWGDGQNYWCEILGSKVQLWGGRCFSCARCRLLIRKHIGPWLDGSSALQGDSALTGAASDKTARAFGNQSILHTAGKSASKTHNTKALIHKFQALVVPALPV